MPAGSRTARQKSVFGEDGYRVHEEDRNCREEGALDRMIYLGRGGELSWWEGRVP